MDAGSRRWRFRRRVGLIALALAFAAGRMAKAQEEPMPPIHLGRILFYPSATLTYEHSDNVPRTNENDTDLPPIASGIQDFRPSLRFELPFERSFTSLAYSPKVREYSSKELAGASGTSHYFDFIGQLQILPSLSLDVRDEYVDGISELADVDPGGELRFGIQPFKSNGAVATLEMTLGPVQSLEAGGNHSKTHFENVPGQPELFDFHDTGLFLRYLVAVGPGNQVYITVDQKAVSQQRGSLALVPTDYQVRSAGAGFRRGTGTGLMSDLRVSYAAADFPQGQNVPFRGFTYEGTLTNQFGPSLQTALKLRRGPRISFFNTNAYYVNEMVELSLQQNLGLRAGVQLTGGFQDNSYPEAVFVGDIPEYAYLTPSEGMKRHDRIRSFSGRFLFRMGRGIELSAGYRRDQSDSNIVANDSKGQPYSYYSYKSQGVMASLMFGWK